MHTFNIINYSSFQFRYFTLTSIVKYELLYSILVLQHLAMWHTPYFLWLNKIGRANSCSWNRCVRARLPIGTFLTIKQIKARKRKNGPLKRGKRRYRFFRTFSRQLAVSGSHSPRLYPGERERYPGHKEVIVLDPRPRPVRYPFVFASAHVGSRSFTFPSTRPSVRNENVALLPFFFARFLTSSSRTVDELITFAFSRANLACVSCVLTIPRSRLIKKRPTL